MRNIFIDKSMEPYIIEGSKCDFIICPEIMNWDILPSAVCVYRTLLDNSKISMSHVNKITITDKEIILTENSNGISISIDRRDMDNIVLYMKHHVVYIAMESQDQFTDKYAYPKIYESLNSHPVCGSVYVRLNQEDHLRFLTNKHIYMMNLKKIRKNKMPIYKEYYLANGKHLYEIIDIDENTFVVHDYIKHETIEMSIIDAFISDLNLFDNNTLFITRNAIIRSHMPYESKQHNPDLYKNYDKYLEEMKDISKFDSIKNLEVYKDFYHCSCEVVLIDEENNHIYTLYNTKFQK